MRQVGGDGAEFLDGGLHALRGIVCVAADEGVAPGGEGAEGAVEAVVFLGRIGISLELERRRGGGGGGLGSGILCMGEGETH